MSFSQPTRLGSPSTIAFRMATIAATILVLDLAWLGVVARGLYDSLLGPLKRPEVYWPAALGFVTYSTYELTNWAVIRDWPAALVPIDLVWGVVLTAVAGLAGKLAHTSLAAREE